MGFSDLAVEIPHILNFDLSTLNRFQSRTRSRLSGRGTRNETGYDLIGLYILSLVLSSYKGHTTFACNDFVNYCTASGSILFSKPTMSHVLASSVRRAVTSRSLHTSRILATTSSSTLHSQLSPAELQKVETDVNKAGLQKTIKGFGRSRIFRDEKGPTYEHRFLKGPGTVAVSRSWMNERHDETLQLNTTATFRSSDVLLGKKQLQD